MYILNLLAKAFQALGITPSTAKKKNSRQSPPSSRKRKAKKTKKASTAGKRKSVKKHVVPPMLDEPSDAGISNYMRTRRAYLGAEAEVVFLVQHTGKVNTYELEAPELAVLDDPDEGLAVRLASGQVAH